MGQRHLLDQIAQGLIPPGLEHVHGWRLHKFYCLTTLTGKSFSLLCKIIITELVWFMDHGSWSKVIKSNCCPNITMTINPCSQVPGVVTISLGSFFLSFRSFFQFEAITPHPCLHSLWFLCSLPLSSCFSTLSNLLYLFISLLHCKALVIQGQTAFMTLIMKAGSHRIIDYQVERDLKDHLGQPFLSEIQSREDGPAPVLLNCNSVQCWRLHHFSVEIIPMSVRFCYENISFFCLIRVSPGVTCTCNFLLPERRSEWGGGQTLLLRNKEQARGNGLKLCQDRLRLDMKNGFFPKGFSRAGSGCPGQ